MPLMMLRHHHAQIGGFFYPMKYTKPHLTFEQQVDLLVSRGLVVKNRKEAVKALSSISYYRLSGYGLPFQSKKDHYNKGTTIDQVLRLYTFDHQLRVLVFDALEFIEVALRTSLTYYLADVYGPFGYTTASNFSSDFKHTPWLADIIEQLKRSKETFIKHYHSKYTHSTYFPLWMATEVFSFGALSRMYKGLHFRDQKVIAQNFGVSAPILQSRLHSFVYLRNLCAHHARLWNRELAISPQIPAKDITWRTPFVVQNNRIFGLLSIICYCSERFHIKCNLKMKLIKLLDQYPEVPLAPMGFHESWKTHQIWK